MSQYQQVDYIFNNNNNNNNRNNSNLNNFSTKSSLQLRAILSNKILSVSNNVSQLITHQIKSDYSHNKLIINDYILTESKNANVDSYGTAFNKMTSKSYFWKKLLKKEYMQKLEPYYILEETDNVYKIAELITNSNDQYVYMLFDQHFGDLHTYMKYKKRLDESEARLIFRQCVEIVDECHQNGIILKDIKLKKFVFLDEQKTKIGLANLEECLLLNEDVTNDFISTQHGCPAYVSPEVLNNQQSNYTYSGKSSDIWSLGIVLYILLIGRYPFHNQSMRNMFAKIARGKFQIPPCSGVSLDARVLLRSLIRVEPDERMFASEILSHNWFKQNIEDDHLMTNNSMNTTDKYSNLTSVTMAVNYLNNLNSNRNVTVLNNSNIYQRKPLEPALSVPLRSQYNS